MEMSGLFGQQGAGGKNTPGQSLETRKMEKNVVEYERSKSSAAQLVSLIRQLVESGCESLELFYNVIRTGIKFLDAKLIDDSFWYALMVSKTSETPSIFSQYSKTNKPLGNKA